MRTRRETRTVSAHQLHQQDDLEIPDFSDEDNKASTSTRPAGENRSGAAYEKGERVRGAYEIWERDGIHGDHERHWEQATSEIDEEEALGS